MSNFIELLSDLICLSHTRSKTLAWNHAYGISRAISEIAGWSDVEWFGPPRPEGSNEGKTHLQVVGCIIIYYPNTFSHGIKLCCGTCHPPFLSQQLIYQLLEKCVTSNIIYSGLFSVIYSCLMVCNLMFGTSAVIKSFLLGCWQMKTSCYKFMSEDVVTSCF